MRKAAWLVILFVIVGVQLAVYARYQPRIAMGNGRGDDGVYYGQMAEQFAQGHRPQADAPFVYRVGTPWLAGTLSRWTGLSVDESFQAINLVTFFVLILVIYVLGLQFCSPPYAALICLLYSLPFYSYARAIFFYPVHVDTLWYILVLCALLLMVRSRLSPGALALLCLLSALASLVRENGVVIPLSFLLSRAPVRRFLSGRVLAARPPAAPTRRDPEIWWGLAMLACSLAALVCTHLVARPTGNYSFLTAAIESVRQNTMWHLVVSFCLACGGALLGVLLIQRRQTGQLLAAHPELGAFAAILLVLAYVGGVDTVRFFSWAAPAVLIAIAVGAESMVTETRTIRPAAVRYLRYGLLLALLALTLATLHPFDGYYDDYTAWEMWGGLQGRPIGSLKPVLLELLAMGGAAWLWNLTEDIARKDRPS